jgi:very-short-patch-repair endonuclease
MWRRRHGSEHEVVGPGAHRTKVRRARELRTAPTPAEAALWDQIRGRRIGGWKFRRQQPIVGYVVDFYCPALRLVIEVDGDIHLDRRPEDELRTRQLARLGVKVLRIRNDDVLADASAAARTIAMLCEQLRGALPCPARRYQPRSASPFPRNRGKGAGG